MKENNIDKTKYSRVKKVLDVALQNSDCDDPDIDFVYICASCFPNIWNNVEERMKSEYLRGYTDCLEEFKNK